MNRNDPTTAICSALLQIEICAIETYTEAIGRFADPTGGASVGRIRVNHLENAIMLRRMVSEDCADPCSGFDLWGGFVHAIRTTGSLIGESPALRILQQIEEQGIREYHRALSNTDVSREAKELIRQDLLPSLTSNVLELQGRRSRKS
jgi:hypothetical protein